MAHAEIESHAEIEAPVPLFYVTFRCISQVRFYVTCQVYKPFSEKGTICKSVFGLTVLKTDFTIFED